MMRLLFDFARSFAGPPTSVTRREDGHWIGTAPDGRVAVSGDRVVWHWRDTFDRVGSELEGELTRLASLHDARATAGMSAAERLAHTIRGLDDEVLLDVYGIDVHSPTDAPLDMAVAAVWQEGRR